MSAELSSTTILVALCLPIVGAIGVQLLGRFVSDDARDTWTVAIGLATFSQVIQLVAPVMSGARPRVEFPDWMAGLGLGFEVEPLGQQTPSLFGWRILRPPAPGSTPRAGEVAV